ncbi:conserved hypothetical protein [Ricinus communis]|uniref:Uncharacterized protein n=1 Tax=Ricinus communis TaxID=3988 RepID=B9T0Q8_RICCO|nr:conserved hypothetical protein [Ricinus communis]
MEELSQHHLTTSNELNKKLDMLMLSLNNQGSGVVIPPIQNDSTRYHVSPSHTQQFKTSSYHSPTSLALIEFPHFNAKDVKGWIFKGEHFL